MAKKHSYRVLIADDEAAASDALRLQIESLGHEVVGVASDGQEAIDLAVQLTPDLAILDIRMPEMDGITAGKLLMEQVDCPVMLLTGFSDEEKVSRAVDAGAFYYLTKPVRLADLQPGVEVAIARFKDKQSVERRLEARTIIDRAKGILIDQFGYKEQEAHKKIHFLARNNNRTMADVSKVIIETGQVPD